MARKKRGRDRGRASLLHVPFPEATMILFLALSREISSYVVPTREAAADFCRKVSLYPLLGFFLHLSLFCSHALLSFFHATYNYNGRKPVAKRALYFSQFTATKLMCDAIFSFWQGKCLSRWSTEDSCRNGINWYKLTSHSDPFLSSFLSHIHSLTSSNHYFVCEGQSIVENLYGQREQLLNTSEKVIIFILG